MKRIALSPGDPAGIGPEICLRSLSENIDCLSNFELIGDINFYKKLSIDLNLDLSFQETIEKKNAILVKNIPLSSEVILGSPDIKNSKYTLDVLLAGSLGTLNKDYSALVTGPINKKIINDFGFEFSGHTEFLADISNTKNVVMLLANSKLKVALLTTHIPLSKVPETITTKKIIETTIILNDSLKSLWKIKNPKICILGLNPHAGEGGFMGKEEMEVIEPAVNALLRKNINVDGPLSADTAFLDKKLKKYDAYLAMFHDQGLPVLKSMGFGDSVNITLGLPFTRVSVDHGTAYELAGKNKADPSSFKKSMELALEFSS
jgi:4-hydroxythreonine-4-phosphate dehydrogenase